MSPIVIILIALGIAALLILITVSRLIYICAPNEVLIFSGAHGTVSDTDARTVGYRLVQGGRGIRVPIYTTVQWDHFTARQHPEWICVDERGQFVGTPPFAAGFYRQLNLNSPYVEAFLKPHVATTSCLLYTSPSPRDRTRSRMPSSA